jgi:hypothetical protein
MLLSSCSLLFAEFSLYLTGPALQRHCNPRILFTSSSRDSGAYLIQLDSNSSKNTHRNNGAKVESKQCKITLGSVIKKTASCRAKWGEGNIFLDL